MNLYKSVVTSAIKVEARNVANTNDIDSFVQSLLDRARTDKVKTWLTKTFRKHIINNAEAYPVRHKQKHFPDYINNAIETGQEVFAVIIDELNRNEIYQVIDYLNTLNDINFGYEQAKRKSEEWHKRLAEQKQDIKAKDSSKIVVTFSDGFTWRLLQTQDDYKLEGKRMGHCVGDYIPGEQLIYSLRDLEDKPHVTIELDLEKPPTIEQIKGKENRPQLKYKKYVVKFIKKFAEPSELHSDLKDWEILSSEDEFYFYREELDGLPVDGGSEMERTVAELGMFPIKEKGKRILRSFKDLADTGIELDFYFQRDIRVCFNYLLTKGYVLQENSIEKLRKGRKYPFSKNISPYEIEQIHKKMWDHEVFFYFSDDFIKHFSDFKPTERVSENLFSSLTKQGFIPTKKQGIVETKKIVNKNVEVFIQADQHFYFFMRKNSLFYNPVRKVLQTVEKFTREVTNNYTKIVDLLDILKGSELVHDVKSLVDEIALEQAENSTLVDMRIVPFSLLKNVTSKYGVFIYQQAFDKLSEDYFLNCKNALTLIKVKGTIKKISAIGLELEDCDLNIGTIKVKENCVIDNTKLSVGSIETPNKLRIRKSKVDPIEKIEVGSLSVNSSSIKVKTLEAKRLTFQFSVSHIEVFKASKSFFTLHRRAYITIDKGETSEMPNIDFKGNATLNNERRYEPLVPFFTGKDRPIMQVKGKKNLGFIAHKGGIAVLEKNIKNIKDIKQEYEKRTSKRVWEVYWKPRLHSNRVVHLQSFTVGELKKAFVWDKNNVFLDQRLLKLNPHAIVKEIDSSMYPFSIPEVKAMSAAYYK